MAFPNGSVITPDGRTLFILTAVTHEPEEARAQGVGRIETVGVEVPGAGRDGGELRWAQHYEVVPYLQNTDISRGSRVRVNALPRCGR